MKEWIKKNWITVVLVAAVIGLVVFNFLPKGEKEEVASAQSVAAQAVAQKAEFERMLAQTLAAKEVEANTKAAEAATKAKAEAAAEYERLALQQAAKAASEAQAKELAELREKLQRAEIQNLKNFRTQTGGSVVRFIGRPVQKNGITYLPLFKDLNNKGALTEPVEKTPEEVQENITFDGVKPPTKGKLAIYDTVRNPETDKLHNVFAWQVSGL